MSKTNQTQQKDFQAKKDKVPDMIQLQTNLKHNQQDLQNYVSDLYSWTEDVSKKDKNTKLREQAANASLSAKAVEARAKVPLPPIRNRVDIQKKLNDEKKSDAKNKQENCVKQINQSADPKNDEKEKQLKRDITPMFDYYNAWEKFAKEEESNVDKDDDTEIKDFIPAKNPKPAEERKGPMTQAEMMQRTSGAKPNTKIVIKGGSVQKNSMAEQLKQQGNAYFVSLDYERAIDCYTRCIPHIPDSDHVMRCIVFSNRSQSYIKIKKYEQAFMDAEKALQFDANHLKSIQRRGTAAYYTHRFRQARKDFVRALQLEASPQIEDYLKKVLQQIEKNKIDANDKLKRQGLFNCGIDFIGNDKVKDIEFHKRKAIQEFKQQAEKLLVTETNLDSKQIEDDRIKQKREQEQINEMWEEQKKYEKVQENRKHDIEQKKTEQIQESKITGQILEQNKENKMKNEENKQLQDEDSKQNEPQQKQKKKKNKKQEKKKGIEDFMEDEKEQQAYEQEQQNETKKQETQKHDENSKAYEKQDTYGTKEGRSILMRDGERSDEKKHVNFDETQNIVKEFSKLQLINQQTEQQQQTYKKKGKGKVLASPR